MHALIHYDEVRVPAESLLGGEGQAFAIAQTRLGGGRVHHAMRTVATCQKALDLLCERVLSRRDPGQPAGASSSSRVTSPTPTPSWPSSACSCSTRRGRSTSTSDYQRTRKNIAAIKALTPKVVHDAVGVPCTPTGRWGVQRDALRRHVDDGAHHERGRRPDRGPQGHRGPRGPEGLRARQRDSGPPPTCPANERRPARSWRHDRAPRRQRLSRAGYRAGRPLPPTTAPDLVVDRGSPRPVPAEGQVVVDVAAAAVNFPDVLLVADHYQIPSRSLHPGSEFAGTVRRSAPASTTWPPATA